MYYFPMNLALTEIYYSLSTVPKMLLILLMERKITSFTACALQLNCAILFVTCVSSQVQWLMIGKCQYATLCISSP